jgi:predicted PurR-regulated permease PerM
MKRFLYLFIFLAFFISGLKIEASNNAFDSVSSFRVRTYKNIYQTRIETQKRIDLLENISKSNKNNNLANKKVLDSTEKPIAYLKLFLLSIASFVFSTDIVFYLILILVLYFVLKLIYRKIRNK